MTVGKRAEAIADFTRAIELTPEVKGMEVVYVNRANTHWLEGNRRAAEADLAKALAMNPDFALAYNLRGRMKADANDLDGAIADFDRAIKIEPKMMPAYVARAAVNLQAGRLEQSISDYKTLMWVLPQDADIVASHGIVRGLMGETGFAIRDLIRAAVMNPKSVSTEARGGAPAPVRRLDQYIEMNPNEARAHLIRGALSSMNGETERSEREFARAIQLDPKLAFEVEAVRKGLANPGS
jgi:tetratricopeptide (TPR) repeat protein